MSKFIKGINRVFGQGSHPAQRVTRAQAKELILNRINTLLEKEGFVYKKGNSFWRVAEEKTDVIELRFLTFDEHQKSKMPESSFSVNYGCFYHFIPDIYNGKFLHEIAETITPPEAYCHYRNTCRRSIEQKSQGSDCNYWHLDVSEENQKSVINDVIEHLQSEAFTTLKKLADLNEWLKELNSNEFNLGMGDATSVMRFYLLGFTYKKLGINEKAKESLIKAKELFDNQSNSLERHLKNLSQDTPLLVQQKIIENALAER